MARLFRFIVLLLLSLAGPAATAQDDSLYAGSVSGTIFTSDNRRAAGVTVSLHSLRLDKTQSQVTGADGQFRFEVPSPGGRYTLEAKSDRGHVSRRYFSLEPGDQRTILPSIIVDQLSRCGSIAGTVLGKDGPVVGITVKLVAKPPSASEWTTLTDLDGTFDLASIPAGPYEVGIVDKGKLLDVRNAVHIKPDEETRVLPPLKGALRSAFYEPLDLSGSTPVKSGVFTVAGTAREFDGSAATDVQVELANQDRSIEKYATPDGYGQFIFEKIPSGSNYLLSMYRGGKTLAKQTFSLVKGSSWFRGVDLLEGENWKCEVGDARE